MIQNDDVFDALADVRRRKLLVGLLTAEQRQVTGLSGDARELTEANDAYLEAFLDGPMEMEGVDKSMLRMHQLDLPMLAELEFVEWSPGSRDVWRGPRFGELRPILELLADEERTEPEIVTSPR